MKPPMKSHLTPPRSTSSHVSVSVGDPSAGTSSAWTNCSCQTGSRHFVMLLLLKGFLTPSTAMTHRGSDEPPALSRFLSWIARPVPRISAMRSSLGASSGCSSTKSPNL